MATDKPKNTYPNAGTQTDQAWREMRRNEDGTYDDDDLITVKATSLMLGINRNKVIQTSIQKRMIAKRGYYRKGDIRAWMEMDRKQPDSILDKLRAEQKIAVEKKLRQPSRIHVRGELGKDEAKQAKERTKTNLGNPFSKDEVAGGWDRGLARRRNKPIVPPKPMTKEDHDACNLMADHVRGLLRSK